MSFSKKFHWLEIFEYWPSNSSYFCKKHPQFTSIPIHLCLFHSSWRQGLQIFVFSLAPQRIIFSKKVTTMTPLIGGWLWGVITATFFDKMSCRRARVKIKIGMVTFSHPCVGATNPFSITNILDHFTSQRKDITNFLSKTTL